MIAERGSQSAATDGLVRGSVCDGSGTGVERDPGFSRSAAPSGGHAMFLVIGVVCLLSGLLLLGGGGILVVLTVLAYLSASSPANLSNLASISLLATLLCFATGAVLLFIGYRCFRTRER